MRELEDTLKHYGVLGMKWGVRKDQKAPRQNGSKKPKKTNRIKEEWKSLSRERQWKKVTSNVSKMTTKEITEHSSRLRLENDLKRLSKGGSNKDKQDYRRRANMSNQELSRKVNRLRAIDALNTNHKIATKQQREIGKKIVEAATPLAMKYARTKKIDIGDVIKASTNSKQFRNDEIAEMVESLVGGKASKDALKLARSVVRR